VRFAALARHGPGVRPAPRGRGFTTRYYQNGRIYEEDRETLVVFLMDGGRATRFELRFDNEAYGRAGRVK